MVQECHIVLHAGMNFAKNFLLKVIAERVELVSQIYSSFKGNNTKASQPYRPPWPVMGIALCANSEC
jgi:hypothetical protein